MVVAANKEIAVVSGLFSLGECVITPRARDVLESIDVDASDLLRRHHTGDWADMDRHDQAVNRAALTNNARVFSMYQLADQTRVYVITEGDRSVTTILLPSEY
jgi:hypothetical protein